MGNLTIKTEKMEENNIKPDVILYCDSEYLKNVMDNQQFEFIHEKENEDFFSLADLKFFKDKKSGRIIEFFVDLYGDCGQKYDKSEPSEDFACTKWYRDPDLVQINKVEDERFCYCCYKHYTVPTVRYFKNKVTGEVTKVFANLSNAVDTACPDCDY